MQSWDNGTQNLSCWEKSLDVSTTIPIGGFLPPLQASIFTLFVAAGLPLNCVFIFLTIKFKSLRKGDFLLALHVVVADLLMILCLPVAIASLLVGGRHIHVPASCSVIGFIVLLFNGVRFTMMLVLCADRFCAVFFPFYHSLRSRSPILSISFLIWGIWLIVAAIPLGLDCYGYEPTTGFCIMQSFCSTACNIYRITTLSIMIILGGIIPMVMYSMLFCKARMLAKDPSTINVHSRSSRRATLTFFILFLSVTGCAVPTYLIFIFFPLAKSFPVFFSAYYGISLTLFEAVILADPIALMRNGEVKQCMYKLVRSVGRNLHSHDTPIIQHAATRPMMTPAASTPSLNAV